MWAALLAGLISVALQSLTRLDSTQGRARAARLRFQVLRVPTRVVRHARGLTLRLPPSAALLPEVLARLRDLPLAAWQPRSPHPKDPEPSPATARSFGLPRPGAPLQGDQLCAEQQDHSPNRGSGSD